MKTRKQRVSVKNINGYTVILAPSEMDTVTVRACVGAGFIHESSSTLGIHHLLEHVLISSFKPCHSDCILYWDKQGCILNATTDNTVVSYFIKGLPDIVDTMVQYIISILIRPTLEESVLQREKNAVLTELKMTMNSPDYPLTNAFNEAFFVPYGLSHYGDASIHLHNLPKFTLNDLQKAHQLYTSENIVFVVHGNFSESILRIFRENLPNKPLPPPVQIPCFSYQPAFLHVPHTSSTVRTILGFPMNDYYEHGPIINSLLSVLLFNELRTKNNLVYGIKASVNTDHCTSCLMIQFECIQEVFVKTLRILFHLLLTAHLDPSILKGVQRKMIYGYQTKYAYDKYYASYLYHKRTLLTKSQLIKKVKSFTVKQFTSFMKETIQFQQCTLVYQYPTSFHVNWDTFLKIDTRGKVQLLS